MTTLVGTGLPNGDGVLLDGRMLYVVQNRLDLVAAVDVATGTVTTRVTDADFDVPTTIAEHGAFLYAVNARFGTASPATVTYSVVRIPKP